MIKKIKPSKAKLGMFVTEFGQGTFDNPVTKLNKRIETPGELAEIKKQQDGVISIDTARGLDEGKDSPEVSSIVQAAAKGAKSLHFNIGFKSYMQALDCIESVLFAAAGNKPVHLAPARTASRVIADSIIGGNKTECALSIIKTDPHVAYHSVNVAILGATLANHIGLPVSQVREVAFGGLVHDIGTVLVNPGILSKKTEFTPEEYKEMTKHPILGYQLIKRQADVPEAVALCALEHHERFDGSGYPKGLPFEKISPHARLLGIVDTFDAMTNERPHKRGIMPRDALKIMYMERDKLFYSEHLEQFIKCMGIYPVGSFVKLSDGKYGIVMNNFPDSPLTPEVKVILDRKFLPISNFLVKVSQPSDNRENICITECLDPDVLKIDLAKYLN